MSHDEPEETAGLAPAERDLLAELLEAERHRLLVGIRHTSHRHFREELRRRLDLVERLAARFAETAPA